VSHGHVEEETSWSESVWGTEIYSSFLKVHTHEAFSIICKRVIKLDEDVTCVAVAVDKHLEKLLLEKLTEAIRLLLALYHRVFIILDLSEFDSTLFVAFFVLFHVAGQSAGSSHSHDAVNALRIAHSAFKAPQLVSFITFRGLCRAEIATLKVIEELISLKFAILRIPDCKIKLHV
jgi:hypothetical protein